MRHKGGALEGSEEAFGKNAFSIFGTKGSDKDNGVLFSKDC